MFAIHDREALWPAPTSQRVLMVAEDRAGRPVELVEYPDGRIGIIRNGVPLAPPHQCTRRVESCVDHFHRISHRLDAEE